MATPKAGAAAIAAKDDRTAPTTQKVTTFLWFDGQAEEAVNFYTSIFKNSRILRTARYGDSGPGKKGSVMTIDFELDGSRMTAINGGPEFKFNESISLVIHCKDQAEVDYFWEKLPADGGKIIECGWLKDKYGLAWQVTPEILLDLINDKDVAKVDRVMKAMMTMKKIDIAKIEEAAAAK